MTRARLTRISFNAKTGPIPTTIISEETCPRSCPFMGKGCYAEVGNTFIHWKGPRAQKYFMAWDDFCNVVARLPRKQLWRYGVAGDLPGSDSLIDENELADLVEANRGRLGFGYSHKSLLSERNIALTQYACDNGLVINASCETPAQAELAVNAGLPVAIVLGFDAPKKQTIAGLPVLRCPANAEKGITCATCQWCAKPNRKFIVGFDVHGVQKNKANNAVTECNNR